MFSQYVYDTVDGYGILGAVFIAGLVVGLSADDAKLSCNGR